ncbi:MAG: hypothetical protein ACKOYM_05865 [Actinomycetes bacterium]
MTRRRGGVQGWGLAVGSAVLIVALAACGEKASPATSASTTTASTRSTTTTTAAPTSTSSTSTTAATATALAPLRLGRIAVGQTSAQLTATGQVGAIGLGCEAAGPSSESATLTGPAVTSGALAGSVQVDEGVVSGITITEGRTVEGVAVGDRVDDAITTLRAAGYTLVPDDGTGEMFGVRLVNFTKAGEAAYSVVGDLESNRITSIATPSAALCD